LQRGEGGGGRGAARKLSSPSKIEHLSTKKVGTSTYLIFKV
jgi:hypothetical protein